MKQGIGQGVCSGVAIGKAFVFKQKPRNQYKKTSSCAQEQKNFEMACRQATKQLNRLYEQTKQEYGEEKAAIIEVQTLMLSDLDFTEGVKEKINREISCVDAVEQTGEEMAQFFSSLSDPYMKERATDILDVTRRVTDILCGVEPLEFPQGKFIVVAEDLAPSQTVSLPRDRISALVIQKGSGSSHTAILSRTLNIPSLVQANISLEDIQENATIAVDATHHRWYVNPTQQVLNLLLEQMEKNNAQQELLEAFRGKKAITPAGKEVHLFANIGSTLDIPAVHKGDAGGIGLMRTEFLYLGKSTPPTEEEQFRAFRWVAQTMKGKTVILRTLDIGADKQVNYLSQEGEENPALGLRGIRLCLEQPSLFRTQLRAIYRASVCGNLHIMFPMITSLWEIKKAKEICESVRNELVTEGYSVKQLPIGIMIETPAAALISGVLAREVDFFSVGTNDLIQYTLAVDRQNQNLTEYADPNHPALWKLLEYVAKNAQRAGIWTGVCGELGANPAAVMRLIEMGYTEFSMAPGKILSIKKLICESEV